MKVQCDVCAAGAASVFCCADEAALCEACDRRVHRANKLAGKHRRFPFLHAEPPSASSAQKKPLCDICQERKGFMFCKEERLVLCRECDVRVHTSTELMRRHSRFLVTDVRLSSAPVDYPVVPEDEGQEEEEEEGNTSSPRNASSYSGGDATQASASDGSSISEYLTKTLPGWHVEDFLADDADADIPACSDGLDQGGQAQVGGLLEEACPAWAAAEQELSDVVVTVDEWDGRERWVPQMQMHDDRIGSKRPRASPPCSYRESDQSTPNALPGGDDDSAAPLVRCSEHMCPIRVHWHVKTNYRQYWRVKVTINNYNQVKNYSDWNLVLQHPNLQSLTQLFSFNYHPLIQYGTLNSTGMFWGVRYYNEMLLQDGNVQTEMMILKKDEGEFTFSEGWAFPRKVCFDGHECVMPPSDQYPWLPNEASATRRSPIAGPCLLLLFVFFLLYSVDSFYENVPSHDLEEKKEHCCGCQ